MKTEAMSIKEFMNPVKPEWLPVKLQRHFKKYGSVYKIAGVSIIVLLGGAPALASTGIDVGAKKLYYELVNIGKWIIIFKGGIETIKSVGNGDLDGAKKSFFSHLLIYLILLGLPYGMDKVDEVFQGLNA
ncbi:hypothetical protein [Bacillus sp. T33-2]|uniref:hypothetical protein n=1 Tax=Bacillus sp. T33-2 TaxID=2054168 RepID=UPI000C76DACE|nr:hypothetical protein [Bacillus sp. T33-2]PLR89521.1 hypothetical protein CVD19_23610 [Bacillus sp. T33-2]